MPQATEDLKHTFKEERLTWTETDLKEESRTLFILSFEKQQRLEIQSKKRESSYL